MKFLVRNARGKIIEDAEEKRDGLIQTFQVILWPFCVYAKFANTFFLRNTYITSIQDTRLYSTFAKLPTFW